MRLSIRKCVTLIVVFIIITSLFFYAFQSRASEVSVHFEFLGHALSHTGGRFYDAHDDGTGGWLTRWFRTPSQASFLGHDPHPSAASARCPVYTYFDTAAYRRGSNEFSILVLWVQSFWALGFKPIVLTDKDAKKHPHYSVFRHQGLIGRSYSKWLAMAQRGGLFVDYRSIPMPTQDNAQFANFLKCGFGRLTTYASTGEQLLHGTRAAYEHVVQYIIDNSSEFDTASESRSLFEIIYSQFNVQASLVGLATYSPVSVSESFPTLESTLLPSLINAHLHEHFLQQHPVLAVIDPIQDSRQTLFRQNFSSLANSIATCPSSPVIGSCPPGFPHCKPCKPASVIQFRSLANVPHNAYILGSVPHPYTFLSYIYHRPNLDARFVRETRRDDWVSSVTAEIVDKRAGSFQRIQTLKEFALTDSATTFDAKLPGGIWQTWEELSLEGLESALGFHCDIAVLEEKEDASRANDLGSVFVAKDRVLSQGSESTRDAIESWNLAWTEVWYFIRALQRKRSSEQMDLIGSFSF